MIVRDQRIGLHKRKVRKDGWTPAVRAAFLDVLAATCNVTMACQAVGRAMTGARALKRRDGEFARLWAEAIAAGRERLEEELIACALGEVASGDNPEGERPEPPPAKFDADLAIKVLQLQGGSRQGKRPPGRPPSQTEIDAALMARLETLARQLERS